MNQGDTIVLRIDTEDILCVFKGIESGSMTQQKPSRPIPSRLSVRESES